MNNKIISRWLLGLVAVLALLLAASLLPPAPKTKPRASRNSSVNRVATVSLTLPATNAPPSRAAK